MDAFKGKFERTSAEKYEDMLKVKKNKLDNLEICKKSIKEKEIKSYEFFSKSLYFSKLRTFAIPIIDLIVRNLT